METELTGIIHFGKYRGKTIADILDLNPSYLLWADKNISDFKLSRKALYEVFDAILEEQKSKSKIKCDCEYDLDDGDIYLDGKRLFDNGDSDDNWGDRD